MATTAKSLPTIDAQTALAAQAALATQSNGQGEASSGVDKMRELLFGNQMQDYDKRFSVLEDRFQLRLRDLEAESSRSLTNLEGTIKKQLESVAGQFREEKDLRTDADKELERNLREQAQALARGASSPRASAMRSRPCATTCASARTTPAPPSSGCSPSSATSRPTATCSRGCSSRLPNA
jgi:hypothetical protein